MSMSVQGMPTVTMGIVSPDSYKRKPSPFVIDETIPKTKNPMNILQDVIYRKRLEEAKNKPDEERTIADYYILLQDKMNQIMKKHPPVLYMA